MTTPDGDLPHTDDGADAAASAPQSPPPKADVESAPRRFLAALDRPLVAGFIATLGVLAALVLGLAFASISTILVYILLAMFVAVGLDPIVRLLERRRIPRGGGVAIVFSAFALLVVLFAVFVLPPVIGQVVDFLSSVPEALAGLQESAWYLSLGVHAQEAIDSALVQLAAMVEDPDTISTIGGGVLAVGVGFINFISASFVVVALTLYFLAALPATKEAFYALAPARKRERLRGFTERITGSVGSALIGSVTLSSLNAAAVFVLHLVIGLPFAALMAVIAFVITLVPLFGSIIFLILGTLVALFTGVTEAVIFLIAYLVYIQIESYVLSPRIMNRAISIPAALVLIGAMVGGALMGVIGVLVALPVMASILMILREVVVPRQDLKV
jgi:predicted PurR-regulated permease PerM